MADAAACAIPFADLKVVRLLGQGSASQVFECSVYGVRVAVKQLRQETIDRLGEQQSYEGLLRQASTWRAAQAVSFAGVGRPGLPAAGDAGAGRAARTHPNILPVIGVCTERDAAALVMECASDSLETAVASGRWHTAHASVVLLEVCQGLDALHAQGVMHGHLRPSKVLLRDGLARISDVGCAELQGACGQGQRLLQRPDAIAYTAPEMLRASRSKERGCPADLYSLAMIALFLSSGVHPWTGDTGAPLPAVTAAEPATAADERRPRRLDDAQDEEGSEEEEGGEEEEEEAVALSPYELVDLVVNNKRPLKNLRRVKDLLLRTIILRSWLDAPKKRPTARDLVGLLRNQAAPDTAHLLLHGTCSDGSRSLAGSGAELLALGSCTASSAANAWGTEYGAQSQTLRAIACGRELELEPTSACAFGPTMGRDLGAMLHRQRENATQKVEELCVLEPPPAALVDGGIGRAGKGIVEVKADAADERPARAEHATGAGGLVGALAGDVQQGSARRRLEHMAGLASESAGTLQPSCADGHQSLRLPLRLHRRLLQ